MDFVKMEGLGNDFVVLRGPRDPSAADVAAWCDRRRGIGADGVLVVTPIDSGRVRMEYWNADGSPSDMCGNGLRCVVRFAIDEGMVSGPDLVVETAVGPREASVLGPDTIKVRLGPVELSPVPALDLAGYRLESASVGNPHAVTFVDDVFSVPVEAVGPLAETDPHYPDRTNVEFADVEGTDRIRLRVWERGVGETLACGSGAAAAAAVAHAKGLTGPSVTVELLGGPLAVDIADDGAWITGPARKVFAGSL